MPKTREIERVLPSQPTLEGAGVRLRRVFGYYEVPMFDPFLLLDDFHSDNPRDYVAGFPWHPHRGIETVTYMISGRVEHGDSLGNKGVIRAGDVQWMTAGSGIIHQEMPKSDSDLLWGLQLWANLPADHKMMDPRYREVRSDDIPEHKAHNARVKVIAGQFADAVGPVKDIVSNPEYLDISLGADARFEHTIPDGRNVFAYVLEGDGRFHPRIRKSVSNEHVVLYGSGDNVIIEAGENPLRFLLISGEPLGEPVAWRGPIVMNTEEELNQAFEEYDNGTFIKN